MGKGYWLAGAVLALSACGGEPERGAAAAALPAGTTLRLADAQIADMKAVGAEIATRDQAEALARIAGTLVTLSVREGDTVEKGQRIGMIVDSRLGYETSAYGAQVAAARAQQGASASVAEQGAVLAPATGRVLRADIPAGSVVAPGMSIATVTAGPPVLRLMLPESAAGQVRPGARVIVGDMGSNDAGAPSGPREGSVTQVYPAVTGGQVRVDATLPGLDTRFIGRRVSASVEVGTRRALVVPRAFVTTRYGMDQVQLVTGGKRLSMVPVQIAPTTDPDRVEILSGVVAGDTLFAPGKPVKAVRP